MAVAGTSSHALTSVPFGGVMAAHSGKCLSVENASTTAGARILQAGCRHTGSDQWQVQPSAGYYQLIGPHAGQCIAVSGASKTQGAQVVQATCASVDNQLWSFTTQGGGYALKAKNSGMCLDVSAASQADAAPLVQWPCNGSAEQTFQFERRLFLAPAAAAIMGTQSGQCVAVSGSAIVQAPCTGGSANDSWTLKPRANTVSIVGVQSGKCLSASSTSAGAPAVPMACSNGNNQQWRLQSYNNAWRLVSLQNGQCLIVKGGGTVAGTALVQNPCSGVANELWSLHVPRPAAVWSGVTPTQVDTVAAANLPSGKLIAWSAEQTLNFNTGVTGQTYTEVLDPVAKSESVYLVTNTGHDMFCPGTAMLPDGRVLVNGGIDSQSTSLFDPATTTWSASALMNIGRGYEGTVPLPDGSVFTLGGSWSGSQGDRIGERWTPTGGWAVLPGVPVTPVLTADAAGTYRADNHLWLQVLSGKRLLQSGPSKQMNWISTTANGAQGSISPAGLRGDDADSMNGNAALYDVDQILKAGGAPSYQDVNATTSALLINAAGSSPVVKRVAPMSYARAFANAVVLPTGQVMVVGGQTYPVPFSDDNAILVPELWDPASQVFERLPAMATPRVYHSVALLLPDARVWVAGGGLCGTCITNHANYEILTPPYLLNDDGTLAARPAISAVTPATPVPGATLQVTTSAPVASFAMMRLSSVTHTVNNDQRRIPLTATTTDGKLYTMPLSSDPGVLLPGYYMLFAMDSKGVPSAAYTLRVATP